MTNQTSTDRDRVGDFVRRALPRALLERDITWPHSVEWDEESIRLTITRGELTITRALTMGGAPKDSWAGLNDPGPWWTPADRVWAKELTRRLVHFVYLSWVAMRHADETGRLHVTVWKDGERYLVKPAASAELVHLVLEPGLMVERADSAERAQVRRLFGHEAGTIAEALGWGWARVE